MSKTIGRKRKSPGNSKTPLSKGKKRKQKKYSSEEDDEATDEDDWEKTCSLSLPPSQITTRSKKSLCNRGIPPLQIDLPTPPLIIMPSPPPMLPPPSPFPFSPVTPTDFAGEQQASLPESNNNKSASKPTLTLHVTKVKNKKQAKEATPHPEAEQVQEKKRIEHNDSERRRRNRITLSRTNNRDQSVATLDYLFKRPDVQGNPEVLESVKECMENKTTTQAQIGQHVESTLRLSCSLMKQFMVIDPKAKFTMDPPPAQTNDLICGLLDLPNMNIASYINGLPEDVPAVIFLPGSMAVLGVNTTFHDLLLRGANYENLPLLQLFPTMKAEDMNLVAILCHSVFREGKGSQGWQSSPKAIQWTERYAAPFLVKRHIITKPQEGEAGPLSLIVGLLEIFLTRSSAPASSYSPTSASYSSPALMGFFPPMEALLPPPVFPMLKEF